MLSKSSAYGLNEKIVGGLLWFIIIISTVYATFDVLYQKFLSAIISFILSAVCLTSYYLIKYKNAYKSIALFVAFLIFFLCVVEFFLNKGFFDENKVNFLLTGLLWSLIFTGLVRLILLILYLIVVFCLFYIQFQFPYLISKLYTVQPLSEKVFDALIYSSMMIYLGFLIQKEYLKEKSKAITQQEELERQGKEMKGKKQEILAQREELSILYEQLEHKVALRTAQLTIQNQQLNNYTNFSTSKIQQPIQQLTILSEHLSAILSQNHLEKVQDILPQIQHLSNELDELTREVNQILTNAQETNL